MKAPQKFSVLYADENEDSCLMLSKLLGYSDINVLSEHSVNAAFHSAETGHFDLFLLASRFSDGNGFDLCRDLHKFSPSTPIVFYTGDACEADIKKALEAGANAYVAKPDSDRIESMIMSYAAHNAQMVNL